MAQFVVNCPHCDFPIVMIGSYAAIDSIDCPQCSKRVYLESRRSTELTSDQRAAFTGWTSAAAPNSVVESFEEDAPQFVTEDGVTKRIVRRVFRRIARRTVRVGSDGRRVQWEVDWSWVSYLIYGFGFCLVFAVIVFGLGSAVLRPFGGFAALAGNGNSNNPLSFLDRRWTRLRYVDIQGVVRGPLANVNALTVAIDALRHESLRERKHQMRSIYETQSADGVLQAIVFQEPIDEDKFHLGRVQVTFRGIAIHRLGGYYVFQPSSTLLVRAGSVELAKAAIGNSSLSDKVDFSPGVDEHVVFCARKVDGATHGVAAAVTTLCGLDSAMADQFGVVEERMAYAASSLCSIRASITTRDANSAAALVARLNANRAGFRNHHAKERTFNGLRADAPEHAALTVLGAGEFTATDRIVSGIWSVNAPTMIDACRALDGGFDVAKILRAIAPPTDSVADIPAPNLGVPQNQAVGVNNAAAPSRIEPRPAALPVAAGIARELLGRGMPFGKASTVEQARDLMAARYGRDRVVTVRIDRIPPAYSLATIAESLAKTTAGEAAALYAKGREGELEMAMAPIVDLAALAGAIAYGEVECDSDKRSLHIQVTRPNALPRIQRPLARPLQEPRGRQVVTETRVAKLLDEVERRKETETVNAPLAELADCEPIEELRPMVCKTLLAGMQSARAVSRHAYAFALANWAQVDHVPKLIELLDDRHPELFARILFRLGEFRDERTILPVSKFFSSHPEAVGILFENIGDAAEPTVIRLLEDSSASATSEAVRVLKVIGGKTALPALGRLKAQGGAIGEEAAEAIAVIEQNS